MKKSILESLTIKTNKSEFEQMEDLILSSIDSRFSDMRDFVDIYMSCKSADRNRVADTVLWEVIGKLDEVEELKNMLEQMRDTGEVLTEGRSYIDHLNHVNVYNYDNSIEEINLEILA